MTSTLELRREVVLLLLDAFGTPPRRLTQDRVTAIHECGHAIVGLVRRLRVSQVVLCDDIAVTTTLMPPGRPADGYLQVLYAGYCAEMLFGFDSREAQVGSLDDMLQATALFPGHHPTFEITKTWSLVRRYQEVIDRASRELMAKRKLGEDDLLRLMEDA